MVSGWLGGGGGDVGIDPAIVVSAEQIRIFALLACSLT